MSSSAFSIKTLNSIASSGYDAMLLLANAIEHAQSTDPVAARDALAATKDFQGSTYISHYDESQHPDKNLAILTVGDGKSQTYKSLSRNSLVELCKGRV